MSPPAPFRAADALALAAAPVFALMAAVTQARGGPMAQLCGASLEGATSMTLMYLLMSAFHLGPWLRRLGRRRGPRPLSRSS